MVGVVDQALLIHDCVLRLQPDVVIVDAESPSRDTLEHLATMSSTSPRPVVVFAEDASHEPMQQALKAGVGAYVIAGLNPQRLMPVLQVAIARFAQDRALRGLMKLLTRRGALVEEQGSTCVADNDADSDEAACSGRVRRGSYAFAGPPSTTKTVIFKPRQTGLATLSPRKRAFERIYPRVAQPLSARDHEIVGALGPVLAARGLLLVGAGRDRRAPHRNQCHQPDLLPGDQRADRVRRRQDVRRRAGNRAALNTRARRGARGPTPEDRGSRSDSNERSR